MSRFPHTPRMTILQSVSKLKSSGLNCCLLPSPPLKGTEPQIFWLGHRLLFLIVIFLSKSDDKIGNLHISFLTEKQIRPAVFFNLCYSLKTNNYVSGNCRNVILKVYYTILLDLLQKNSHCKWLATPLLKTSAELKLT